MSAVNGNPVTARKAEIRARHAVLKSWSLVAREYPGVKRGTLQRFATNGYEPKQPEIRAALGLPVLKLAPACPTCGVVHVAKRCPTERHVPAWVSGAVSWLKAREKA